MKYIFELASRAKEDVEVKHQKLVECFRKNGKPWGIDPDVILPFPDFGKEHFASMVLDKYFGKGIQCSVYYRYRNMLSDHHSSDDRIYFEFNAKKQDYESLITVFVQEFIYYFEVYRGELFPEDLIYVDFDKSRNINLRERTYRFYPVMFLDRELCKRALLKTPEEIVAKLDKNIEKAELYNGGVLITASSRILNVSECNEVNERIGKLLDINI
jgi:hypothetical protein